MEERLDFLTARPGGGCLLGCSCLTGRCWSGSVWLYDDPNNAPDIAESQASYQLHAGVTCAVWVSRELFVLAEDGGYIEWLSCDKEPGKLCAVAGGPNHISTINSISLTCDKAKVLTASADRCINVLDCSTQRQEVQYSPAHAQDCLSIDAHPTDKNCFISCSLDGNVLLWDTRQKKPASSIYRDIECPVTTVLWQKDDSLDSSKLGNIYMGTMDGRVMLHSTRHTDEPIATNNLLDTSIRKFIPCPNNSSLIAVYGDEETVKVIQSGGEILTPRYSEAKHRDFVRDVLWLDETSFLSCGWDKIVATHTLLPA